MRWHHAHYAASAATWGYILAAAHTPAWHSRHPAQRAYRTSLTCFGFYSTLTLPPVYTAIDQVVRVPNLTRLLSDSLIVFSLWRLQPWVTHFAANHGHPEQFLTSRKVMLGMIASMAILFAQASRAGLPRSTLDDFTTRCGGTSGILTYTAVGYGYSALALARVIAVAVPAAQHEELVDDPILRLRTRLGISGCAIGIAYCFHEILRVALRRLALPYPPPGPRVVHNTLAGLYGTMITAATLAPLQPAFHYLAHWRLYPLWHALYQASPGIARWPAPSAFADALPRHHVGAIRFRLRRRVAEIWDGIATLRIYRDARVAEQARRRCRDAGITGDEAEAVVEATVLATAIRAKGRRQPAAQPYPVPIAHGGRTLDAQAAYLARVARALQKSPIVAEILRGEEAAAARR